MKRNETIRDVIEAAHEFNGCKLWKHFTNYDCFGVRVVDAEDLILAVVLGDAGEEYGVSLFRGPQAVASPRALLDAAGPGDDVLEEMDTLGFSMEAFGHLPPDAQAQVREGGWHPRYDEQVPHFLAKPSGQQGRLPDESELALLLLVLRGAIEADKKKLLRPATLEDEEGICVVDIRAEATAPQVNVTREKVASEATSVSIPLLSTGRDLRGLPRLKATWLVGMPAFPAAIEGDDRAMQMLLVVDDTERLILQGKPIFSGDLREAADSLAETFRGKGLRKVKGLPRRIVFSSRKLHEAMVPVLEPLGVRCSYKATIPKLRALMEEFYDVVDSDLAPFDGNVEFAEAYEKQVPAPDDLKGWKEADKRLFDRFGEHFDEDDRLWSARPVKRYFGDDDLEYYLQEHEKQGVVAAYTAWGILDYRANRTSKTQAERMLEKGLPEPEAILLRSRMEALPTLYRVAGHHPKVGTIDLEDALLGGSVTVHDQLMSENMQNNAFLTARAFAAGRFHFIEMAGPPLGPRMGKEAIDFLRSCGMKFMREGLRKDAHKFGWLWQWMEDWQAHWRPPRLSNTDGDELLWHTASFSVADPESVRQALRQRQDVEYDDREDEFTWIKKTGPGAKALGGPVTLARIEFVGDELVLSVNSAKRFTTARQWLEKLPGVTFKSVTTRRWDEAEESRPLDERISPPEPVAMTPELVAALQERMNQYYLDWVDTPLPALAGKTPRQACRNEAGRQEVLMLIRTMPDPVGPGGIRAPREAMLRELGLGEEPLPPPPAQLERPQTPIPIDDVPAKPKVPRNAPCPCGSGRKYKKCCGRQPNGQPSLP